MADNFFKVSKGVTYKGQATDPSNPTNGDIYYNTTSNKFRAYQNGVWHNLAVEDEKDTDFTIVDASDPTKILKFDAAGTAGTSTTLQTSQTSDRIITLPDATDVLVGKVTVDVLSNKTLKTITGSVIADGTTTGSDAVLQSSDIQNAIVRLTNVSLVTIGGIPAGGSGQILIVENQTGNTVTIIDNDSAVTAANRIRTGSGGAVAFTANAAFIFTYDNTAQRWILTGGSGSGTGNANTILETLKNEFVDSPYQLLTPNIIATDAGTKFASFSGASADTSTNTIKFTANAQTATSVQMLDTNEFLNTGLDVGAVDLSMFWDKGQVSQAFSIPDAATSYSNLSVSTLNSSAVVTVTTTSEHHLVTGSKITVTTANAVGGISSANLSVSNSSITFISPTSFSYTAGGSASSTATGILDTVAVLGFLYEVSRDGGTNWFTIPMTRVGVTEVFRGALTFDTTSTTEATKQTLHSQLTTGSFLILNASSAQSAGQAFTVTSTEKVQQIILGLESFTAGHPKGNMYISIIRDAGGTPSTNSSDIVTQTNAISLSTLGLTGTFNNFTFDLSGSVLVPGTYHIVITTDAAYKAQYTASGATDNVTIQIRNTGGTAPLLETYNGTSWSSVATSNMVYTLKGRALDLRTRITSAGSPTYPCGLDGYGIFYNLQDVGIVGSNKKTQRFGFNSVTDNLNSFTITGFNPDPDLLTCWYIEGGQGFKVPAFSLNGNTAIFPANSFYNGGVSSTVTLVFEQNTGGAYDNSDINARLLATNHLGSSSGTDDKSAAGRGVILRRPDGTLREIAIDNNDNIFIISVP